jgi:hypothetical protein
MKNIKLLLLLFILFAVFIMIGCNSASVTVTYPYNVSQAVSMPQIFAKDIISTPSKDDWSFAFTPDGHTIYIQQGDLSSYKIFISHYENGKWSSPTLSEFSSKEASSNEGDIFIAPDGSKIFYASDKKGSYDLWMVDKKGNGWGTPTMIEAINKTTSNEWLPSVSNKGNLYFESDRADGKGSTDIYMSRLVDSKYTAPLLLGDEINTEGMEESPFIAPDESYLIFSRQTELYISYNEQGKWTKAEAIAPDKIKGNFIYSPYITPDQKYLFYSVNAEGSNDIYQVDVSAIGLKIGSKK